MPITDLIIAFTEPAGPVDTMLTMPVPQMPECNADEPPKEIDLLSYILNKVDLVLDQHAQPVAFVKDDASGIHRCYRVRSRPFDHLIRRMEIAQGISKQEVKALIEELEGIAICRNKKVDIHPRFAHKECKLYLDLCNDSDEAVEIDQTGWRKVVPQSAYFARHDHQLPLPTPVNPTALSINSFDPLVAEYEVPQKLLLLAWLTSCFNHPIEVPIVVVIGPPGSGKSTLCRSLKDLVDPSFSPDIGNLDVSNLPLILQQHAVPNFENVSCNSRKVADHFCRATTGGAIAVRRLFTNDELSLFRFRRPILMNGVELPTNRPDFLDRSLVFSLSRRTNNDAIENVVARQKEQLPQLLGSLLTLVSKTLATPEAPENACPFRMASFARWGRRVARALGLSEANFDDAYKNNTQAIGHDLLETDLLVRLLHEFASKHSANHPWKGAITDLQEKLSRSKLLHEHAGKEGLVCSAKMLNQKLKELAPLLAQIGVIVEQLPRTKSVRPWRVYLQQQPQEQSHEQQK